MGIQIDRLDGLSSSTAVKGPCRCATTANITLSDLQTIDGVALADGDRVLVRAQTDARDNGIYVASTGNWRRSKDFSSNRDVRRGTKVTVTDGTTYATSEWICTATNPVVFDTSEIAFAQIFFSTGSDVTINAPGWITRDTLADLNTVTPANENYGGSVLDDPDPANNGFYYRSANSWVKGRGFPDTFAELTITGGTVDAITASVSAGVDPSVVKVFWIDIPEGSENTGNVTIDYGDGPVSAVNYDGSQFAAGEFRGRMVLSNEGASLQSLDAAAQSATDAEAALAEFNEKYLGAFADDASATAAAGGTPVTGAEYWSTSENRRKTWDGTTWAATDVALSDGTVTEPKLASSLAQKTATVASSIAVLKAIDRTRYGTAYLSEQNLEGFFGLDTSDLSSVVAPFSVTSSAVDDATDTITSVAHGLTTGDAVIPTSTVDGLTVDTFYYVIRVDADNIQLAESLENAVAGTAFDLTGTSAITLRYMRDPRGALFNVGDLADVDGSGGAWVRDHSTGVSVKWFGAKGDGKSLRAATTIASAGTTLTVSGAAFTAGDVGKIITVEGAGAAGATLYTTIASITDADTVEVDDAAGTELAAALATVFYGTDDADAINAAIKALTRNSGSSSNAQFGGRVLLPAGMYLAGRQVTIDRHGVEFVGVGGWADTVFVTAHAGKGLYIESVLNPSTIIRFLRVAGIRFLSAESTRTAGSASIWINGTNLIQFVVEDCWFAARQQYAIYGVNLQDGHIRNNRIDGPLENAMAGFSFGIRTLGIANQITIENNWIENTQTAAIRLSGDASFSNNLVTIRENLIQGNDGAGIDYDKVRSIFILRNWFEANGRSGLSGLGNLRNIGANQNTMLVVEGNVLGTGGAGAHANYSSVAISGCVQAIVRANYFVTGALVNFSTTTVIGGAMEDNWSFDAGPTISGRPNTMRFRNNRGQSTGALWLGSGNDPASGRVITKTDGATTVAVDGVGTIYLSDTGATSLTDMTGAVEGQEVVLIALNGNTTVNHTGAATANTFKLPGGANITPGLNDTIRLRYVSSGTPRFVCTGYENNA